MEMQCVNFAKHGVKEIRRMRGMKKIFSLLVACCLLLSLMPTGVVAVDQEVYGVSTTIGDCKFFVNEAVEFTATTHVVEGAETKTVVGAFELYDSEGNKLENVDDIQNVVKLEYKEYPSGLWYEFYGEFGPSAGFPMMNGITSTFRATFKTEGSYKVKVLMKDVNDGKSVLCSTDEVALNVSEFVSSKVETSLPGKVYLGQDTYFTCTTTANSQANETVLGSFVVAGVANVGDVATLKYQDSVSGNWYEFYGDFGPAAGFPLMDATSHFCVNFKQEGIYNIKVFMKKLDGTELCAVEKTVKVTIPSELTTNIGELEFVTGQSQEFTFTSTANGDSDEWVYGKFEFSDWDAVESLMYWGVTEAQWLTLPQDSLFGPAATGFPVMDATSRFLVTFNKTGTFTCKVALVSADDQVTEICSVTENVTVIENVPPVVESVAVDNENWAQSKTVTVNAKDEGGSTVAKVVYSNQNAFNDQVLLAELQEDGSYSFQVAADGTYYVWAVDGYGNCSEVKEILVEKIDTNKPEITEIKADPDSWTNGSVTVKVKAQDAASGVAKIVYSTEDVYGADAKEAVWNEELECYTFEVSLASDEEYFNGSYYVWALDNVGILSEMMAVNITIETISPSVDLVLVEPNAWTNKDVTVSGKVLDDGDAVSGISKVYYGTSNVFNKNGAYVTPDEEGKFQFTISNTSEYNGSYYIWVEDIAGNVSEAVSVDILIDTTKPVVDTIGADPAVWTNGDVTVSGKVSDTQSAIANSGVVKVVYGTTDAYNGTLSEATLNSDGTYTFTVSKDAEYNGKYYVWAVDAAGNVSEAASVEILIDTTKPVVDTIGADPAVWTNGDVTVSGKVSDTQSAIANSGVVKVVYGTTDAYNGTLSEATLNSDGTYTFTVSKDAEYNGKYYVWAVDAAGNVSEAASVEILIDTTKPVVDSLEAEVAAFKDGWTNQSVKITAQASDENSPIANSQVVAVYFNTANELVEDEAHQAALEENVYTYTVPAENFNGRYYFWAKDAAGNISEVQSVEIKIDVNDPTGEMSAKFSFTDSEEDYTLEQPWVDLADKDDALNYKLWANKSICVSISEKADDLSGVAEIWRHVDYFEKDELKFKTSEELDNASWVLLDEDTVETIDTDNRFIVYVKIVDNAGNYTYISTNGLIVDTHKPIGDRWGEKIDIAVDHEKEAATIAALDDVNNVEKLSDALYNPDDTVKVNIDIYEPKYFGNDQATEDKPEGAFSGLRHIEYQIFVDGEAKDVVTLFDVNDNINVGGTIAEEIGLVYNWTGEIEIDKVACNSNDVEVVVTAIDNAGNIAVGSTKLMIDVTAPVIRVEYSEETEYSSNTRTATIYVQERNFVPFELESEEGMENTIIATHGSEVAVGPWTLVEVAEEDKQSNGDHITHMMTVVFEKDDHYQISNLKTDDAAGNPSEVFAAGQVFTIDKTLPVVTVSYNNNSAQNGKYFKAYRTATVTVVEHNVPMTENGEIDDKAWFTIKTARGGQNPLISWSVDEKNADTYIAKIVYSADGDYTFAANVSDLASNTCEDTSVHYGNSVAAKDFVIDTKVPAITYSGVENGNAYGHDAEVIPSIRIQDINLQNHDVSLVGVQKGKTIDLTAEVKELLKGGVETITGVFDIFETKQDLDGIYTLKLSALDKAGNDSVVEVVFTVNRFGSVYVYSDELMNLIRDGGQYVGAVDTDLVITEYNADKLLENSLQILITRDGETVEVEYTSTPAINDQVSTGSSGWYEYVYTIKASNFAADGVYKMSLSSKYATSDAAENESTSVPENSQDQKGEAVLDTMTFTVDSTVPEIRNIINLDKAIADKDKIVDGKLKVEYTVVDVGGLKSIEVLVNGKTVQTITEEELAENPYDFTGSFELAEQTGTVAHKVQIVVTDLAGNVTDTNSEEFQKAHSSDNKDSTYVFHNEVTVSRNFFVRFYANKGLFWGSIGGVIAIAAAVCILIAALNKKKGAKK